MNPPQLILECGATHGGFEGALDLILEASKQGGDFIKFQIFDPEELCQDPTQTFSWVDSKGTTHCRNLRELLQERRLTYSQWAALIRKAKEVGIGFIATVGNLEDVDFLTELDDDVSGIKISSADINHIYLIDQITMCFFKDIHVDTGNAVSRDIQRVIDIVGSDRLVLHYCPKGYPCPDLELNLSRIHALKKEFPGIRIAYSDHGKGTRACLAAVALGVSHIEKVLTRNSSDSGIEHCMGIECHEIRSLQQEIMEVSRLMGSPVQWSPKINPEIRRGIYAKRTLYAGEILGMEDISFRRPERVEGFPADQYRNVLSAVVRNDIEKGQLIAKDDIYHPYML